MLRMGSATFDFLAQNRVHCRGLLHKPVEQFPTRARSASVKTKGELVKIVVQMRRPNGALVRSRLLGHKSALVQAAYTPQDIQRLKAAVDTIP